MSLDLDAIRARANAADVPRLIAEIERLREQLVAVTANAARWASVEDRSAATAAARAALMRQFEDQVDPDRVLDPAERELKAHDARRQHFAAMAAKSAEVRRAKKRAKAQDHPGP